MSSLGQSSAAGVTPLESQEGEGKDEDKGVVADDTEQRVELVKGDLKTPSMNEEQFAAYSGVAKAVEIGSNGAWLRERLLWCLREEGLGVYRSSNVVRYLDWKLGKEWQWHGVRAVDVVHLEGYVSHTYGERDVTFNEHVYSGVIPLLVLHRIRIVLEAVPEAHFCISCGHRDGSDSFLAVVSRGMGMFIIERWMKSSFGGSTRTVWEQRGSDVFAGKSVPGCAGVEE